VAFAALVGGSAVVWGAQQPQPTFRTGVEAVSVSVIVTQVMEQVRKGK
jgi:hypothetical protein